MMTTATGRWRMGKYVRMMIYMYVCTAKHIDKLNVCSLYICGIKYICIIAS